jgi:hypothetical protein
MAMANNPDKAITLARTNATMTAASVPPIAPDQVFFGLTCADRSPGEISDNVGRPHDREQKNHRQETILAVRAQHDRCNPERAGIGHAGRDPRTPFDRRERRYTERADGEHDDGRQEVPGSHQRDRERERSSARHQHGSVVRSGY